MRQTKIKNVKDGKTFKLSKRSKVAYKVISKGKGLVTYTSLSSDLSFTRSGSNLCWVDK